MTKPAADEPEDPREEEQKQAQEFAQQLMRTAELAAKLEWRDFDFGVDSFDPLLQDLANVLQAGNQDKEMLTAIFQMGLPRHVPMAQRARLLAELERRTATEVRLDVRQEAQFVMRALQQLNLPTASIGLVWALYPAHMVDSLRARHAIYAREDAALTAEDRELIEAIATGKGGGDKLAGLGERIPGIVDRAVHAWDRNTKVSQALAKQVAAAAAGAPSLRMARALSAVFWNTADPAVHEAAREGLKAMPAEARAVLETDVLVHDPPPEARRAIYPALIDAVGAMALPRLVEDVGGGGPWSTPGKGAEHAKALLGLIVGLGDRRAVPMMLHMMSMRPPAQEVRAAIAAAFAASPMKEEFERGLAAIKAGKPVVVAHNVTHEEFFNRYAQGSEGMRQDRMQTELRRVSALWEECYHERLGWRKPAEAAKDVGPRERELRAALEREVREKMGRLAGRAPVAALEDEFRTRWLVTPRNDVSGRPPLAIILDERASRGADAESLAAQREEQGAELYGLALKALEAGLTEDAERLLRAALQIVPGHAFAADALDRMARGAAVPGLGPVEPPPAPPEEPQEKSRIIVP